jgi:hypothetical protein
MTRSARRVCRADGGIVAIKGSYAAVWLSSGMGLIIAAAAIWRYSMSAKSLSGTCATESVG